MLKVKNLILFLLLSVTLGACLDGDANQKSSLVNVYITDAPGDFDEVYLELKRVEVFVQNSNRGGDDSWVSLYYIPLSNVVNISALVNGSQLILGRSELPLGKITQIKLVFGDEQYLVLDEEPLSLVWEDPSEMEYIIDVDYTLEGGRSYDIVLDIDLARSITDSDQEEVYLFSPKIRSFETGSIAAISGTVSPLAAQPYIYAILGEDSISTLTDDSGNFLFNGLEAGDYAIYINPRAPYQDSLFTVTAKIDSVTVIETILLPEIQEEILP